MDLTIVVNDSKKCSELKEKGIIKMTSRRVIQLKIEGIKQYLKDGEVIESISPASESPKFY